MKTSAPFGQSLRRRTLLSLLPAGLIASPARAEDFHPKPLPSGQTRTVKLAVGGVADVTHLAVWYAKYAGYFDALKADGITVEVTPFGGGSEWLLALASGQVNMAHGYFENAVRARSQGRDMVLIDNILPTPAFLVVIRADLADKVRTVKDVKGLSWGFTSFGSASHVVSLRVAKFYGLEPSDVKWLGVGGSTGFLPALREKRVDIITASVMTGTQLIQEGTGKLLQDVASEKAVEQIYGHPYLGPGMLTSHAYCEQEPFVVLKVVSAVRKAITAVQSTPPAEIAKKLPAEFQVDSLVGAIDITAKAFAPDGEIPESTVVAMIRDMSDLKMGKGGVEPADMFDNRFIHAVKAGA
jgi:NitT/TauT family transport system substrate-binding protein